MDLWRQGRNRLSQTGRQIAEVVFVPTLTRDVYAQGSRTGRCDF